MAQEGRLLDQRGREEQPAQAQPGRQRLGDRAGQDHPLGGEPLQCPQRLAVIAKLRVVAAVRERFGVKGLLELTHMVAWENHRSRVNVTLGLEADDFSAGAACARPQVPQRSGLSG